VDPHQPVVRRGKRYQRAHAVLLGRVVEEGEALAEPVQRPVDGRVVSAHLHEPRAEVSRLDVGPAEVIVKASTDVYSRSLE
jgi:hypothetical protein